MTIEHDPLSQRVIGCAFTVSNTLGSGFLEKVYENALVHELRKQEMNAHQQYAVNVHYDGVIVGEYVADIVVDDSLIVELKAAKSMEDIHLAQCLNYLNATGFKTCLLLNFGTPKVQVKRISL